MKTTQVTKTGITPKFGEAVRGSRNLAERVNGCCIRAYSWARYQASCASAKLRDESGQGTTEYAILVGVLVVIAIGAIALLKPELEELWDDIVSQISSL